ncbi:doubletime/casein kinase i epsilon [Chiua virens]|nr:doubletime/casein kinase i epsilon [Chiua virens]
MVFIGMPAFAAINSHLGNELSHRDDIESLIYILISLSHGSLPWFNWKPVHRSTITNMKLNISYDNLSKTLPVVFLEFLKHTHSLTFTEQPDYVHFKSWFQEL